MGLCPLPLYLDGHVFLHMAEVILCPKLAWKEFSFCFAGWNAAFWSSQSSYKKCETLRTPQQEGALTRTWWNPLKMPRDPADQSQLLWCPVFSAIATSIWLQLCEGVWARPNHLGPSQIPHRDGEIIKWELQVLPLTVENTTYGVLVTIFKKKNPHPTTIS